MCNQPIRKPVLARAFSVVVIALLLCGGGATAAAQVEADRPTPWDAGRTSLLVMVGNESSFGENYFLIGAGVGYFVLPGVELELQGVQWFGGDPSITMLSPGVRYVAVPLRFPLKPYLGAFYSHYFVGDPFQDEDSIGGRLGVLFHQRGGVVIGGGAVAERFLTDCDEDCTSIYPEISVGFTF